MTCREILSGTACSERVVRKKSTSKSVFAKKDVSTCWAIKFHTTLNEPVETVDGPMQHSGPTQNFRRGKSQRCGITRSKMSLGLEKKLNEFQKRRLQQLPNSLFSLQGTRRFFEGYPFFVPEGSTATAFSAKTCRQSCRKIQLRSFSSVVRDGFNRSRSLVFRFSTAVFLIAQAKALGEPISTQIFLARVMPV